MLILLKKPSLLEGANLLDSDLVSNACSVHIALFQITRPGGYLLLELIKIGQGGRVVCSNMEVHLLRSRHLKVLPPISRDVMRMHWIAFCHVHPRTSHDILGVP